MTWIILLLFISYVVVVFLLVTGWQKAKAQPHGLKKETIQSLSVIIPVRNEEATIDRLMDDLIVQSYPKDKFEIIIVNDHSEDNTIQVVGKKIDNSANLKIASNEGQGKKLAITTGVSLSNGEIIVTTDADCRVDMNWLETINNSFFNEKIKMVFGAVKIQTDDSLFSKLQAIEFSSLIGSGAATMAIGIPTMCNGANLAFRKEIFFEVNGYEGNTQIASGDDEFLMRKISGRYPYGIRFNNSQENIVSTNPLPTLAEFIDQRLRWAGKWRYNKDGKSKLVALYIFLFHLSVLALPILVILDYLSLSSALLFLLGKAVVEFMFLRSVNSWLKVKWNWPAFILLQLIHSFYVVTIGVVANFAKPLWKGR
jgi:cellulose synthase/poly-beta-1,6-N-acetylglucosamine synthase-like glycosyltransferase